MPKSKHVHKSMLLRGVKFKPPALNASDIEQTKGKAAKSGRSHGGVPLKGDGRGRNSFNYAGGNQSNQHQGYGQNNRQSYGSRNNNGYSNARNYPPPPPGSGWAPPPPGMGAFGNGPPPPPPPGYGYNGPGQSQGPPGYSQSYPRQYGFDGRPDNGPTGYGTPRPNGGSYRGGGDSYRGSYRGNDGYRGHR
jgi:5'-3' exoribonuclease 2